MQDNSRNSARVNVSEVKKDFGMLKRMILQIIICILIYTIFYMVQNTNYVFSEDIIKKTKEILSYDINVLNLYNQGKEYLKSFINIDKEQEKTEPIEEISDEKLNEENMQQNEDNTNIENIGGESITDSEEKQANLSQMEQDAKYILETKSLIIPLKGTITSRYGLRDPATPTVPKNHTGIDIAVNEGTVFIAAMTGIVEQVSSERRPG